MAGANSKRIFHDGKHSGPGEGQRFGDKRSYGPHGGVDYSAAKGVVQYAPLDGGVVNKIVTGENNNARGLYVLIHYPQHNLGLYLQHASEILVALKDAEGNPTVVNKDTPIIKTGMTGKDKYGKRVSNGNHAHVEIFDWSTGTRHNYETYDLESKDSTMTEEEAKNVIRQILDESIGEPSGWAAEMWNQAKLSGIRFDDRAHAVPTREQVASMILRAFLPKCGGNMEEDE